MRGPSRGVKVPEQLPSSAHVVMLTAANIADLVNRIVGLKNHKLTRCLGGRWRSRLGTRFSTVRPTRTTLSQADLKILRPYGLAR